jgi:hypothetical protein
LLGCFQEMRHWLLDPHQNWILLEDEWPNTTQRMLVLRLIPSQSW